MILERERGQIGDLIGDHTNAPKVEYVVKRLDVRYNGIYKVRFMAFMFKLRSDGVGGVPKLRG